MIPIFRVLSDFFDEFYSQERVYRDYLPDGFRRFMTEYQAHFKHFIPSMTFQDFEVAFKDLYDFFSECFPPEAVNHES